MVIKVGEVGYIPDCAILDPKDVHESNKDFESMVPIVKAAFESAGLCTDFGAPKLGLIWIPSFFAYDLGFENATKGIFAWCAEKTSGKAGFYIGFEGKPSNRICVNHILWLGEYYSESHWDVCEQPKTIIM